MLAATDLPAFMHSTSRSQGGTLITVLLLLAIVSGVVAAFYQTLIPKHRSVYHAASWQEALHGAEAGADYGLQVLNNFATTTGDPNGYDWAGSGWRFADEPYRTDNSNPTVSTKAINGLRALTNLSSLGLGGINDVRVTALTMDVYTRDTDSTNPLAPRAPWFRIRSSARAKLPGRLIAADSREAGLRRLSLSAMNGTQPDPHVSRTIETIARPKIGNQYAIQTRSGLTLGNSSNWRVDSFDSGETAKSDPGTIAGGVYPSNPNSTKIQSNGSIASLQTLPNGTLYGPLINGNGATVLGNVRTAGGDNPATAAHENVSGSGGMTQSRIFDDHDEELIAPAKPVWSIVSANPAGNTGFVTSASASTPRKYIINGNLGTFAVAAPPAGTIGYVSILVNGNLSIGNGTGAKVVIPPNVYATVYVDGNVDFGNGQVNSDAASSKVATRLTIFGVSTAPNATYSASGNAVQILNFNGPNYAIDFDGTVATIGAVTGKSFLINGGGNGGFHYDEALGRFGQVKGWETVSYFDDSRKDL